VRYPGKWPSQGQSTADRTKARQDTTDFVRIRGTAKVPLAPRDVIAQPGPRGVLITWNLPTFNTDITGWRVYKGDENTLFQDIADRGVRTAFAESTGAASSPVTNFFVSSRNALGKESQKIQVKQAATNESGAPSTPGTPPAYTQGYSGGGNQSDGQGSRPVL